MEQECLGPTPPSPTSPALPPSLPFFRRGSPSGRMDQCFERNDPNHCGSGAKDRPPVAHANASTSANASSSAAAEPERTPPSASTATPSPPPTPSTPTPPTAAACPTPVPRPPASNSKHGASTGEQSSNHAGVTGVVQPLLEHHEKKGVLLWNVQGLFPFRNRAKIEFLRDYSKCNLPYIISLTESHLNQKIESAEIRLDNYSVFRCDRLGRSHGGVITYIRSDIPATLLFSKSNSVCEALAVKIKVLDLIFATIYRPPASKSQEFEEILTEVQKAIELECQSDPKIVNIVLTGDYNLPWIQWDKCDVRSEKDLNSNSSDKIQSNKLIDVMGELFLTNHILSPTRGRNILDLVLTNNPKMASNPTISPCALLSDHSQIEFEFDHQYRLPIAPKKLTQPYFMATYKYELESASKEDWFRYKVLMRFAEEKWNQEAQKLGLDQKVDLMYKIVEKVVSQVFQL